MYHISLNISSFAEFLAFVADVLNSVFDCRWWMVRLCIDVLDSVVRLHVWMVFACVEI